MNKKGFTMVEILGVIVLLALVSLVAIPSVNRIMRNSRNRSINAQIILLIDATKKWSADNIELMPRYARDTRGDYVSGRYIVSEEGDCNVGLCPEHALCPLVSEGICISNTSLVRVHLDVLVGRYISANDLDDAITEGIPLNNLYVEIMLPPILADGRPEYDSFQYCYRNDEFIDRTEIDNICR